MAERSQKSRDAVLLFFLLALGYFYSSVQRISAGVILPHMAQTYGFSAALVGFLSSLFFYTYGLLQGFWGAINDRIGPLRACAVGLALAGIGAAFMLVSHSPFCIGVSRFLCGLGLAALFTGIYLYAAIAFSPEEYPYWVGWITIVANAGTVVAVGPLGFLIEKLGYGGSFFVLSAWALVVAVVLWFVRDRCPELPSVSADLKKHEKREKIFLAILADMRAGLGAVLESRPLCVVIFVWSILSAAIITLQGLWGVSWLVASSGASWQDARFWVTFVCVGLVIGSPLGTWITKRSAGNRSGLIFTIFALCAAWGAYWLGAWLRLGNVGMGAIGITVGVTSGIAMVYCISTIRALSDISRVGLVLGIGQTFLYASVILFQWGSGVIINRFPGESPGAYLNDGYLVAFGIIVSVILFSLMTIFSVPSFRDEPAE